MTQWRNGGTHEYSDVDKDRRIYRSKADGAYSAADGGGWLPGLYADEDAARRALDVIHGHWSALETAVHWSVRGEGDNYRLVTVEDLDAIAAEEAT